NQALMRPMLRSRGHRRNDRDLPPPHSVRSDRRSAYEFIGARLLACPSPEPRPSAVGGHRWFYHPAAATADGHRPDSLCRAVEALEELAEFAAGGAARDGGVAPSGLQALLGMEESTPTGSAADWDGTAGSNSANEPQARQLPRPPLPWGRGRSRAPPPRR